MNFPKVILSNKSESISISLSLKPSEDATLPKKGDMNIEPKKQGEIFYNNATANLFVWDANSNLLLWQGIVPTKSQKIIDIYPDEKKIMFGNIEIPSNFETVTSLPSSAPSPKSYMWVIIILIIILILLMFWFDPFGMRKVKIY